MRYNIIACLILTILINSFTSFAQTTDSIKDPRDGQVYQTVKIGDQWWMAQNLNFKIGDSFYYLNDSRFSRPYGRLYVYDDAMRACPAGWHLPSDTEWTQLTDYLGGESVAAGKMKKTSEGNWDYFKPSENNESGFAALPGGCHSSDWEFGLMRFLGFWWTSTNDGYISAWNRHMECGHAEVSKNLVKKTDGLSVRCIKD